MKRDIGKAVYTIELQGAGKALQDLYSLDRAAQKVGKSFQSAMGGGRFNKTGGGGSRPSSGGGNVVERMLASRLPGQGMVNVPGLINDKQIKAIEKALADTSRTFSTKQKEVLERALVMLKSSKDVTGATIEFANSYIRGFDDARNKSRENLQQLRAAFTAMTAVDPGFGGTGAGKQMQRDISLAELQIAREQNQLRLSRITGGFDRDVVAAGMQNAREAESGVMSNMRLAAMKPFTDGLNQALATGKNISAMLTDFQVAERRTGDAVNYVNRLYIDRVDALRRIRMFGEQALRAEEQRRVSTGEKPLAPEEAVKFQAEAEVKEATSMVPLIQQQKQYQNQLENVSAALIRVREEQARIAAAGGSESELRSLEVAEASLEKQANDLRQLNTLYDQLNDAVIQLANAQRAAAANPGSREAAKNLKEMEAAYLDASHRVNELKFAVNNADNDLRTTAKGAKNAGFAMIQASYGVQDFIQVLAGGGGLKYALLASANNFSQVIVASDSLRKSLGGTKQAFLALGVTAGMLAVAAWFTNTKTEADRMRESIDDINKSFGRMESIFLRLSKLRLINPAQMLSSSAWLSSVGEREEEAARFRMRQRRMSSVFAGVETTSAETSGSWGMSMKQLFEFLTTAGGGRDLTAAREAQLKGATQIAPLLADQGDVTGLQEMVLKLRKGTKGEFDLLTPDERSAVADAIDEMIESIMNNKASSDEFAARMKMAASNIKIDQAGVVTNIGRGMTGGLREIDEVEKNLKLSRSRIVEELKDKNITPERRQELEDAYKKLPYAAGDQIIDILTEERGSPLQRMDLETLDEYKVRADEDLTKRIERLQERRDLADPSMQPFYDAAIDRAKRQQADLAVSIPQQQANMQARAFFAAQGNVLGQQMQGITEETQAAVEAAKRDLSGAQLATVLADIASADTRKRTIAQRQFGFGQESAMAGFQGQVLGAMGTPEARMAQEDLNLVGQFRDIQAMLDSGALGTGPGALAMAQDMLDMATAVSEQRKKDIEFENKKAGFSDIGSLWKQIQMSLKPDKSTQLQQQSVNILTAIQNRLAQGLSLTIP